MRKRVLVILALFVLAAAGGALAYRQEMRDAYARWQRGPVPPAVSRDELLASAENGTPESGTKKTNAPEEPEPAKAPPEPAPQLPSSPAPQLPTSINLEVLFVPQAPFRIWDEIHEDTCEEASVLMVEAYEDGTTKMSLEEMDRRMLAMVEWERNAYGETGWKSTTAAQVVRMMHEHLGMAGAVAVPIDSLDDVRREVAAGRPVIVPAAGKLLNNPNFKNGGPLYHMLVIKGYTPGKIITNDPGTRVGADYVYDEDVVWNAIHDWNGGDVYSGAKVMIIVK